MAMIRGSVERRIALRVSRIHQAWMGVQQLPDAGQIAALYGVVDRIRPDARYPGLAGARRAADGKAHDRQAPARLDRWGDLARGTRGSACSRESGGVPLPPHFPDFHHTARRL